MSKDTVYGPPKGEGMPPYPDELFPNNTLEPDSQPNIYCIVDYPGNIFGVRVRVQLKWNPIFKEWYYSDCSNTMLENWFKKYPHLFVFTDSIFPPEEDDPAPAPIVGERGPNLSKIEEQVDRVLAAETDESLREWYDKQPDRAPTEQALPEEHPAVKSQKYIPTANVGTEAHPCAEYAAGLRKLLREAHGELAAANDRIKELQEWHNSHQ